MRKLYMLAAGLLLVLLSWAQQGKIRCYSDEYLREQIRQHPERGRSLELLEQEVGKYVEARLNARNGTAFKGKPGSGGGGGGGGGTTPRSTVVYVPVVVHVVYNTPAQRISDVQVASQIEVLNKDFRKANVELGSGAYLAGYDNLVADALIQFCLVETKYVPTTVTSFGTNDAIKRSSAGGSDPVDPATKLNIWVGNLGGGILGYAQFPGGTLSTDGVVVLYSAFGTSAAGATAAPYDEGRTATHEVGHWFGLRHIWGDRRCGDDLVGDTPPHDGANYGCLGSGVSVGLRSQCGDRPLEMWMNYMDYTDDKCMYMFSNGQKLRMDGFIAAGRAAYCLSACPAGTITRTASPSRAIQLNTMASGIDLYPSATGTLSNAMLTAGRSGVAEISILNSAGTVLRQNRVALAAGKSNYRIIVDDLPGGLYFIRYSAPDGSVQSRKLLVQH